MIEKIINWTAGSFFRTIGRLLVFVLIGVIISRLVDFGSLIDSFSITDLFFEKVNASGIAGYGYFANAYKSDGTQLANGSYFADGIRVNITDKDKHILFNNQGNLNGSGISLSYQNQYKQIVFQVGFFSNSAIAQVITSGAAYARFARNGSFYASTICYFTGELDADFDTTDTTSGVNAEYYNLVCPLPVYSGSNITLTRLTISTAQTSANEFFEINRNVTYLLNENYILEEGQQATTDAINSQTQQQQEQHNEVMDDNTTEAESEGTSFFEDFSQTDHGGLSSILTAPLTIFNKILDDTCVPATFTYRGKTVSLPCGQEFWNQAPNLRDWLSMIESGIIAYAILISLFKLIQKLESPSNSEVEVESL